ncbi:MAG: OmpA family protein [Campylobacterales bacterium]|nr:OmpA family protein [Campylobacterales bacterium]
MKSLLICILLISSLHCAISEFQSDDYQIIIGKEFDDEALDIVEDHDHTLSLVGYTQNFATKNSVASQSYTNAFDYLAAKGSAQGEQLRLIKLGESAQIITDVSLNLSEFNRGKAIIKTAENGYLLGGYTHSGQMMMASLDTQGRQNHLKKFGTANFDQLHALVSLEDGGSVAIGTSQTSRNLHDDIFVQGLGKNDIYLVRFGRSGDIQWEKKYGTTGKDTGVDAVSTGDGGFIVIGLSQESNSSTLIAAKISDTGDSLWIKSFPKEGRQKAFKIIRTDEENYLISASFENKDSKENIRLITIDNKGNTLWEKNLYADVDEQLSDICIDLKGNILGIGYSKKPGSSDMDGLVRYYDHNANILWERKFGKKRQDAFKSVALLHDNSFAIAGFSNSFSDMGRQIWVLKLNDDGSMVKKESKKYRGFYEALLAEFAASPRVHIYKDLRITHDGLIFKQGSSTLTQQHKSTLSEFMPRLLKVMARYKSEIKHLRVNGYTSSEWIAPETQRYLNNAHLSNDRAMHVLDYSYQLGPVKQYRKWISQILSTDGYSYSNLLYKNDNEDSVRSRRVEFEIRLK